jgi:hypothetical protein
MAHITADRVRQLSTSTGTGPITVSTTFTGFRAFSSVLSVGDTFWYTIASTSLSEWEVGLGTYSAANTITRTTVLSSSTGSPVLFSAGDKDVFITAAAGKFLQADSAGSYGNFTAGTITAALTGAASSNVLKAGDTMTGALVTTIGGGVASSTKQIDLTNGTGYDLFMLPRGGAGAYNTLTQAGDAVIGFSAGAINTGGLVIGPWSASGKGIRIDSAANTVTIAASSTNPSVTNTQTLGTASFLWNNVYATTFTGALTGNASTATALETSRTLWGQAFTGAANVTGNLTSVGNITGTAGVTLTATSGTLALAATGANTITASTNSTTRLTITAAGDVGIGTAATTAQSLGISKNITGGTTAIPLMNNGAIQADVTGAAWMFRSSPSVVASAFTVPTLAHFSVVPGTLGASSTITNEYGALYQNTMVNATNTYGVYSSIPALALGSVNPATATATSISQTGTTVTVTATAHGFATGQYVTVAATANATDLTANAWVTILTLGDTNFTLIGAATNTVGLSFTASGPAAALTTGTVTLNAQGSGKLITVVDANTFTYTTTTVTNPYTAITLLTGVITPATRWNIYALGSASNYFGGSVGIGYSNSAGLTNVNLRLAKTMVGGNGQTTSYAFYNAGQIQTDVTTSGIYNQTVASTAGAVTNIYHNIASQGTLGGTVTNQYGFVSASNAIGATNNYGFVADNTAGVTTGKTAYGFYSSVNTQTGGGTTYGFYAAGTAPNYFSDIVGIGANPVGSNTKLFLGGTLTGGATRISVRSQHTFQSDVTLAIGFSSAPITQATTYTLANLNHFRVDDVTLGASSVVTSQMGVYIAPLVNASTNYSFYAENSAAVAATKTSYGFYSNNAIATGGGTTWNFYANGSAPNYFAGYVGIGATPTSVVTTSRLQISGDIGLIATGAPALHFSGYYNSTAGQWQYGTTGQYSAAIRYDATIGALQFWTSSSSGTAGALSSIAEKMRIDASGNVTPGVTNTQTLGAVGDVWSTVHANTVSAIFHESVQTISTNYTITAGSNAMTPGPITIASGVTVTVPSGSVWTIV